ncbi:MAG: hypothetical protein GY868_08520 [Deltaproteobacteria bacterium]|nr:hypothetical protein [Deltaproteobacteria bacterium]
MATVKNPKDEELEKLFENFDQQFKEVERKMSDLEKNLETSRRQQQDTEDN